jgi:hypothetical protein
MALASLVPFGPKKVDVARLKAIMYRAIKTTGTLIVIKYYNKFSP